MSKKVIGVLVVIGCIIVASGAVAYNADKLYISNKNLVTVNIPDKLFCNSQPSMLVLAHDIEGNPAQGEVSIDVFSDGKKSNLYRGQMDESGYVQPLFTVPNITGDAKIIIKVGNQEISKDIEIVDTHRILLSTDKPLYQPGQTMHIRLLLYEGIEPIASQHSTTIEIADPDGNLICKKTLHPNEYGLANLTFPLSDQLPLGTYEITAQVGGEKVQKVVMVKRYVLPKFSIDIQGMKPWYLIDEPIRGTISCKYFFGKNVEGNVSISIFPYLGVWLTSSIVNGTLVNGTFDFTLDRIFYIVEVPIEQGNGLVEMQVTVTDTGGHQENETYMIPIADSSIVITTLADKNVVGATSTYYVIARDPGGIGVADAQVDIVLDGSYVETVVTDERGVASFSFLFTNQSTLSIRVVKGSEKVTVSHEISGGSGIKVLPEKNSYVVGDIARFYVYYSGDSPTDWVYYDVISEGFVTTTGRLELMGGIGNFSIVVTPDMIPLPKIRVYKIQEDLTVAKDTAVIGVSAPGELSVTIHTGKDEYLPHENITLGVSVTNGSHPVVAALGVTIVDKSIFEISERFNGLEKLYYELEEEFITPQYEIHEYIFSNFTGPLVLESTPSLVEKSDFGSEGNIILNNPQKYRADAYLFKEKSIFAYWMALLIAFIAGAIILTTYLIIKVFGKLQLFAAAATLGLCLFGIGLFVVFDQAFTGQFTENPVDDGFRLLWDTGQNGMMPEENAVIWAPNFTGGASSNQPPTQLRHFFPETWFWDPFIITDEHGNATITLITPDSLTTWDIEAIASTRDAQIGVATEEITVFKEFFVEPDVPVAAVRGDEFPLGVLIYNYGNTTSTVKVQIIQEGWYDLLSQEEQLVTVSPNSVTSVAFTIRPTRVGAHNVTIYAFSNGDTDAVKRQITVDPDGKPVTWIENGELRDDHTIQSLIFLSPERIPGSENAFVKIQGGMESIILDGAEGFLQFVSGCGEQSMSLLAIDVLAYQNLLKKEGITTEQLFESETLITQGIQHELMYLVDDKDGRGIVWFPHDEGGPHPWLTSWGLITFQDAQNAGFTVDSKIISDMQRWLIAQQESDGSYKFPEWGLYETTNPILQMKKVATTAYITRALLHSGYPNQDTIKKSLEYIQEHIMEHWNDSYTLALALIALEEGNGNRALQEKVADQLLLLKKEENGTFYWVSESNMYANSEIRYFGSSTHTIETTAYVIMALQKQGGAGDIIKGAVSYLLNHRSQIGGFSSTQDTIVALQALNGQGTSDIDEMTVSIRADDQVVDTLFITQENKDVTHLIDLRPYLENATTVQIVSSGQGSVLYQIFSEQYLPWEMLGIETPQEMLINVTYDTTTIAVDDMLTAHVTLRYNGSAESVRMILIDLRSPVGFSFITEDFETLVEKHIIDNFEVKGRQALVYIENLTKEELVTFNYHLLANKPIKGTLQGVKAFDMYNPALTAETLPIEITSY